MELPNIWETENMKIVQNVLSGVRARSSDFRDLLMMSHHHHHGSFVILFSNIFSRSRPYFSILGPSLGSGITIRSPKFCLVWTQSEHFFDQLQVESAHEPYIFLKVLPKPIAKMRSVSESYVVYFFCRGPKTRGESVTWDFSRVVSSYCSSSKCAFGAITDVFNAGMFFILC